MKYLGPPQSGSQADSTASHNRAGQYYRNRISPVQPVGTGRRATVRANFSAASSAWGALTGSQQAAWNTYAAMYPYTDALGQSIVLTGQQMYVAINASRLNAGLALAATIPVSNATIAPVVAVFTMTAAGVMTLTLTPSGGSADKILLAFSKPQSSGTGFCKTFWQQLSVAGNSAGAATYGTAYVAQFGLPSAGNRVFYRLTPVNQYGVAGVPVIAYAVVT